ncbi:hypothetical protein VDGE_00652 [Verticillium dahliae]|uniref:Zn(2)-C6 fungal-type domain-containing protein n=1 Tax=Verticillium dahliae TaxID=27337 RepID=A0A444S994_VERDA|nr:hypothetical protein VDGE_00652 [Verticillium dahliae]
MPYRTLDFCRYGGPPGRSPTRLLPLIGQPHQSWRSSHIVSQQGSTPPCDETRPICDRCRKGTRECLYPDPPPAKGSPAPSTTSKDSGSIKQQASPTSSHEAEDVDDDVSRSTKLETIPDEDEDVNQIPNFSERPTWSRATSTGTSINQISRATRQTSESPSADGNVSSPSNSTRTSSTHTATTPLAVDNPTLSTTSFPDWTHLSPGVQRYMDYFYKHMDHHNYCIVHDGDNFFHGILPNFALQNEALLNAIVGFSAYLYSLEHNPNGKMWEFLQYYNRGVTLLLASLKRKEKPDIGTLLTILQLATIEEYLGDWINLMGHQRAACDIITRLFTPQTAVQTPLGRMVLTWYSRFDTFVAMMGGFPTALGQEWFTHHIDYARHQQLSSDEEQRSFHWKAETQYAGLRLLSREMSMLYARITRGQMTPEEFETAHAQTLQRLRDWKVQQDAELEDPASLVTDFSWAPVPDEADIVSPFSPGMLYDHPKLSTTFLTVIWLSMIIMHQCQSPTSDRDRLYSELAGHAYHVCTIFELIHHWPNSPKGGLLPLEAPLAISALFVPQDAKHHVWFRRRFALMETKGYIHPVKVRSQMGVLFGAPECERWWLPNDEGFSPLLQAIRNLADERNATAINAQEENLRDVRHIFTKMQLAEGQQTT